MIILIIATILFIILPFIPGGRVLRRKKDSDPLHIDGNKSSSPFATGDRFRNWIEDLKKDPEVTKSPEKIPASVAYSVDGTNLAICFEGDMNSTDNSTFTDRIHVGRNAVIGAESRLRSIYACGDIHLRQGAQISDWLDARGTSIIASDNAALGHNCVCKGSIRLGHRVHFEKMFATAICTEGDQFPFPGEYKDREGNVLSRDKVTVKSGEKILGSISSNRDVVLEDGSSVDGGIFSDGNISLRENCIVRGNIFSQGDITIAENCIVGTPGHIKSLVARGKVTLDGRVKVFGHISCAEGITK